MRQPVAWKKPAKRWETVVKSFLPPTDNVIQFFEKVRFVKAALPVVSNDPFRYVKQSIQVECHIKQIVNQF